MYFIRKVQIKIKNSTLYFQLQKNELNASLKETNLTVQKQKQYKMNTMKWAVNYIYKYIS